MTVEIDLSNSSIPGLPKKLEIKNAAQEETLAQLLKEFQKYAKLHVKASKIAEKQFKSIDKMQKNDAKRGAGGGSDNLDMDDLQDEIDESAERYRQSSLASKAATQAQVLMANALGKNVDALTKNAVDFGRLGVQAAALVSSLAGIGNSVTQAAGALSMIPGIGSVLSSTLGAVARASEEVHQEYTKLASSGANFAGSMTNMISAATGAGLTLEQFVGIVSGNSEAMMLLGGTTQKGAKRFAELGKAMKDSDVNDQLLRMGYTTEQINSGMASYISVLGQSGQLNKMSTEEIAEGSATYLKELDALAKITGKSREEKQKEQEALQRDAQYRAMTSKMSAEEKQEMMSFITSFPESSQGAIKDMLATGTATTEEAKKFAALNGKAASDIMRHGSNMRRGVKVTGDMLAQTKKDAIKEAKVSAERFKDQGAFNKDMAEAWSAQYDLAQQEENGKEAALKEQEENNKQAEALTKQMGEFKSKVATVSNDFTTKLLNSQAIDTLDTAFTSFATFVGKVVTPILNAFFGILQPVVSVLGILATVVSNVLGPSLKAAAWAISSIGQVITWALYPAFKAFEGVAWLAGWVLAAWTSAVVISTAATKIQAFITSEQTAASVLQTYWTRIQTAAMFAYNAITQEAIVAKTLEMFSIRKFSIIWEQIGAAYGVVANAVNASKIKEMVVSGLSSAATATATAAQTAYTAVTNSLTLSKLRELGVSALGFVIGTAHNIALAFTTGMMWILGAAISVPVMPLLLLGAAVTLLIVYWDEIVEGFKWGWEKLKNIFGWIFDGLKSFFEGWIDMILAPFKLVANVVMGVIGFFTGMVSAIKSKLSWFFDDDDDAKPKKEKETGPGRRSDGTTRTVKSVTQTKLEQQTIKEEKTRAKTLKEIYDEKMQSVAISALGILGVDKEKLEKLKSANKIYADNMDARNKTEKKTNEQLKENAEKNKSFWDKIFGKDGSSSTAGGGSNPSGGGNSAGGKPPGGGSSTGGSAASQSNRASGGMAAASANAQNSGNTSSGSSNSSSSSGGSAASGGSLSKTGLPGSDTLPSAGLKGGGGGSMSDKEIKDMIIRHEGKKNKPYKDSLGLWTVGVGHLIGDGKSLPPEWDRTFSEEEIMQMFDKDYEHHKAGAQKMPGFNLFNARGQGALTDLAFNMGPSWYKKWPSFSKFAKEGNAAGAAESLKNSKWYGQVKNRAPVIVDHIKNGIQAADGGVFDGPKSGYPATLHGNEAVVPLKDGNIPVQMTGGNQEDLVALLTSLNSKLDTLIAINASISEVNKSQLRVQKKGLGNPELLA